MAANPISFTEIDAYCRLIWGDLTAWEIQSVIAVDRAVRGLSATKTKQPDVKNETDASDGAGVGALLRGMGATKSKKAAT